MTKRRNKFPAAAKKKAPTGPSYEGNAKHEEPWQRGRRGSLCTQVAIAAAATLLESSVSHGGKRYATDGQRAFEGVEHSAGKWHGWPVGWKEVPDALRHQWRSAGTVKRQAMARHWHRHEESET